jgi:hypothetical protein
MRVLMRYQALLPLHHLQPPRLDMAIGTDYAWHVFHKPGSGQNAARGERAARPSRFHLVPCCRVPGEKPDALDSTASRSRKAARYGPYRCIAAPSFLHHQVRNIVGTLKKIGEGRWEEGRMTGILAAKDRAAAGSDRTAATGFISCASITTTAAANEGSMRPEQALPAHHVCRDKSFSSSSLYDCICFI